MPPENSEGNVNAKDYITFSIARDVILERRAAGLSQIDLAKLAGVRHETICRIESGKHCPTVPTMHKIERALKKAASRHRRAG
ncbi:MAG: helix-turn-helix transcriptional regulator [Phycisphaerales bacterium]